MVHVFNPSTDAEEGVLCEFVASLVYGASSQIGSKAAQTNSSLKREKKRKEKKRKEKKRKEKELPLGITSSRTF